MEKNLLFAALAVVAMASCTKNEISQSTRTNEIKFTTPVLARHTKSVEIDGNIYPTTAPSFNVYAWYNSGATFTASTASPYMSNVKVSYDSNIHDSEDVGDGAWISNPVYYWPKQGVLTFDAYSPSDLSGIVTADATDGIKVENHTVATTLANQQDFLYATRAKEKTSSKGTTNGTYDGVDIAFNHALAVVKFQAKTADDYSSTTTIAIKDIKLKSINNKGTFEQSESTSSPAWSSQSGSETYVALENDNPSTSTVVNTTLSPVGSSVIVLPQTFVASTQELYIEYYIKTTASDDILQKQPFYLNTTQISSAVYSWEMGKRYTYNLVFSLDKVYFAPSVEPWDDETVDQIDVK